MTAFFDDLRFAARRLRSRPWFAAAAVLAFALGIGYNTAMYGVADVLLFRPLAIPDQDRVVALRGQETGRSIFHVNVSAADYFALLDQSNSFESLAAFQGWTANITGGGEPLALTACQVTPSFWRVLGLQPALGRVFSTVGAEPGDDRVAVISYTLWQTRFGSDPNILQRTIQLNGQAYTVIGVMHPAARYPLVAELWTPLPFSPAHRADSNHPNYELIGRLRPGVSVSSLNAELRNLSAGLASIYPATHTNRSLYAAVLRRVISGDYTREYTQLTLYSVAFLLLIACANVAGLQVARASERFHEISIRAALGAGRARLLRLLFTENLLLAGLGALLGLVVASWGIDLMRAGMPPEVERYLPGWSRMGLNPLVLAITSVLTLLAALAAGLAPAFLLFRTDLHERLKDAGRTTAGSTRHHLRSSLVVAEVSLSTVLLAGSALMVKGFSNLRLPHPGLEPSSLLTLRVTLPEFRYATELQVADFHTRALERLQAVPGVQSVGLASSLPYSPTSTTWSFKVADRAQDRPGSPSWAHAQPSNPAYLETMRLRVLAGRGLALSDGRSTPPVALVSQEFVRLHFPGENPLQRALILDPASGHPARVTIVGVVSDVNHEAFDRVPHPAVYLPYQQWPQRWASYVLRTASPDPTTVIPAVRQAVASVDPDQPIAEIRAYPKMISDSLTGLAYVAVLMLVLGATSLFLSLLGVYGLVSQSVTERTREFGVRVALGAGPRSVLWLVLRRGLLLAALGLALGLPAGLAVARLVSGLIFGVSPADPLVFTGVPLALAATALAACVFPARRALRTDPMKALRYE